MDWKRRIACVSVPNLPIQAERSLHPEFIGVPLVLLAPTSSPTAKASATITHCSGEAWTQGLRPGMSVRQVWTECPNAVILEPNPSHYRELSDRLLDALEEVVPVVEEAGLGCAYTDLSGMESLYPDVRELLRTITEAASAAVGGLQATVCAGPNKFVAGVAVALGADARQRAAAWAAAQREAREAMRRASQRRAAQSAPHRRVKESAYRAVLEQYRREAEEALEGQEDEGDEADGEPALTLIPPQAARAFLAPLSVHHLPVSEAMQSRLADFGLRRMGQLVRLGVTAIQAQFGSEGLLAWKLAQGIDDEPVVQRRTFRPIAEGLVCTSPISEWAGFWAALRQLLVRVWQRRERKGAAVQQIELLARTEGELWSKRFTFHEPVGDYEQLATLLHQRLEGQSLPGAIIEMTLQITALAGRQGRQGNLFAERSDWLGQLRRALAPLKARHGSTQLYRIAEVEPWSRIPERRYALIDFDP